MREPTIGGFEEALRLVAQIPQDEEGRQWVLGSIAAGDEKVRVLRYVARHANGRARLLDIGAQIGAMAIYAARLCCEAAAVDYGLFGSYAELARKQGVDYRECDLSSTGLPFPDAGFDFVTYMDVIEHHAFSPRTVLQEIHRVLATGGRLIVTTPNHASIYNRLLLLAGRTVNDPFDYYFNGTGMHPGHHREYTRSELRLALERTGFKIAECRVEEEELYSLLASKVSAKQLTVRLLGKLWSVLHLPFGRRLWAVGVKVTGTGTI